MSNHQAPPPPYAPPPPAVPPARRALTRRQLVISIAAVVAVPVLLIAAMALQPSKLEQAGQAIDRDCFTQAISDKQIQFTANYKSIPCLLTIRAQLEELGFDRGALEDGADRPVRAGRYRLTTAREPITSPVVTITAS